MSVSSIIPQAATSSSTTSTSGTSSTNMNLTANDFITMMVTQLQNQDPLNPTDNNQWMSQLAQFSALEQMNNVSSSLDRLTASSELTQGAALSGRTITYQLDGNSDPVTGVVGKVTVDKGTALLDVNGVSVPLSAVQEIDPPGAGA